jgi:hypothetical protein
VPDNDWSDYYLEIQRNLRILEPACAAKNWKVALKASGAVSIAALNLERTLNKLTPPLRPEMDRLDEAMRKGTFPNAPD